MASDGGDNIAPSVHEAKEVNLDHEGKQDTLEDGKEIISRTKEEKTSSSDEEMQDLDDEAGTSKIKNPLLHMTPDEVIADVDQFVHENGFHEQREQLIKGALIAKDPAEFESVPGITEEEIHVIRNEVLHKWHQPGACISRSSSARLEPPCRDGIRQVPTVQTYHSQRRSASQQSTALTRYSTNG
ncbi:galactose-proton symport [Aspergillus sp. HF37]|nr:galactose-proton symport [Aspergillus sp. HF37]